MTSSYLKIQGQSNLDSIWSQPTINITTFTDIHQGVAPVKGYANYSLWDAGKLFLVRAQSFCDVHTGSDILSSCSCPSSYLTAFLILFGATQASASNIWQNAYVHNNTLSAGSTWQSWSDVQFVTNNVVALIGGVFSTLDVMVQVRVKSVYLNHWACSK